MGTLALGAALFVGSMGQAAPPRPRPAAKIISLAQLRAMMRRRRGRTLVLHFWASWCRACLPELPLVSALTREARPRGIDLYSVSLDAPSARGAEAVARTLAERSVAEIDRTILRLDNPDAVMAAVDPAWTGSIPAFFAYDRKGKLHQAHVGELTRERFEALVGGLVEVPIKK